MEFSSATVEAEIADLLDVSLSALVVDQDSEAVLRRVAGESAPRVERSSRAFNSSLPDRD